MRPAEFVRVRTESDAPTDEAISVQLAFEETEDRDEYQGSGELQTRCILALWFMQGFFLAFPTTAQTFFLTNDLEASPHLQATLGVLNQFAWNMKILVSRHETYSEIFQVRK